MIPLRPLVVIGTVLSILYAFLLTKPVCRSHDLPAGKEDVPIDAFNGKRVSCVYSVLGIMQMRYDGSFSLGVPEGEGVLNDNGDVYSGFFHNGTRHGPRGTLTLASGEVFDGEWAHHLPHGRVQIATAPSASTWYHTFAGDVFNATLSGSMSQGVLDGKGEVVLPYRNNGKFKVRGDFKKGWFSGVIEAEPPVGDLIKGSALLDEDQSSFLVMLAGNRDMYSVNCSVSHLLGAHCEPQLASKQTCDPGSECAEVNSVVQRVASLLLHVYITVKTRVRVPSFNWKFAETVGKLRQG